jgi:hypothetical protein
MTRYASGFAGGAPSSIRRFVRESCKEGAK